MVLSIALMVAGESKLPYMQNINSTIGLIALPIQYIVNVPIKTYKWLVTSITTQHQLLSDNARLRARNFLLQARLQRLASLEKENGELRGLLQSSSHVGDKVTIAQLLAVDLNPSLQQMIVNKGSKDKIYIGQPVFDAYGVVGQVINVGYFTSKVMLLTDVHSAIPVENNRNNVRAVAIGQGIDGTLALINVSETTDIRPGDLMVTSGLGQRYPVGYPVGLVIEKQRVPGEHYVRVILRPVAHLDRSEQVLLSWPSDASLARVVQEQLKIGLPKS